MERKKIDISEERRILSQMITTTPLLVQLKGIAEPHLFEHSYSRLVASWVWEYFDRIGEAPEKAIEDIYLKQKASVRDENDVEMIGEFLSHLSRDWAKATSPDYTAGVAVEFFKLRSLTLLKEKLELQIKSRNVGGAEKLVAEYRRVDQVKGTSVDLMRDTSEIVRAFVTEHNGLYQMPGAIGEVIGEIRRGDFVGVLAPMKRGKSWWLWHFAYRALLSDHKALFISLEMMQEEVLQRAWQCMAGQPKRKGVYEVAKFVDDGIHKRVVMKERDYKAVSTLKVDIQTVQKHYRKLAPNADVRIQVFPAGQATMDDIHTLLSNLELYDNFVPDVIVIDYADLLRTPTRTEHRHQLDEIWKGLRGLAQEKHCAVITASQTAKETLDKDIKASNVSEDIRKLAHVTKGIALNQTRKEKEKGLMRVEKLLDRNAGGTHTTAVVSTCYEIGRTVMGSALLEDIADYEK